ncbi:MAG: hypothetical protein ABIP48_22185 [Planctomycetota bacterium]
MSTITHDHHHARPFFFWKMIQRLQDAVVDSLSVGLPQSHDQDAGVLAITVREETLIRGD